MSNQSVIRPTHVVTCILLRTDQTQPKMLLMRRSDRVGSYNDQWAGVSGFVEPRVEPQDQAFTEIREETTLRSDQVRLLRRGAVVEHIDEAIKRHWYIHPFLFEALEPDAVQHDWEAVEMRWIDLSDLSNYHTVPKLQEVYNAAVQGEIVS
ncbi:MAG TPA: NUDIX domain-containing protein [Ktedonobacteraceae bacterium]|jgi:ADP-ribose pyrophosphatase YjhB (NUDIX family)